MILSPSSLPYVDAHSLHADAADRHAHWKDSYLDLLTSVGGRPSLPLEWTNDREVERRTDRFDPDSLLSGDLKKLERKNVLRRDVKDVGPYEKEDESLMLSALLPSRAHDLS